MSVDTKQVSAVLDYGDIYINEIQSEIRNVGLTPELLIPKAADKAINSVIASIRDGRFDLAGVYLEKGSKLLADKPESGIVDVLKLFVEKKCKDFSDFAKDATGVENSASYRKVAESSDGRVIAALNEIRRVQSKNNTEPLTLQDWYEECRKGWVNAFDQAVATERSYQNGILALRKAGSYGDYIKAEQMFQALGSYRNSEEYLENAKSEAARLGKIIVRRITAIVCVILVFLGYQGFRKAYDPVRAVYDEAADYRNKGSYQFAAEQYSQVSDTWIGKLILRDAKEKETEAVNQLFNGEVLKLTSKEAPWFSLDEEGGLQFDRSKFTGGSIEIPVYFNNKLVVKIGDEAFLKDEELTEIQIPANIRLIGESAFDSCYNLTSVTIPSTVRGVGEYAFASSGLKSVTLEDGCTLGAYMFYDCYELTEVTIPGSVGMVNRGAFARCDNLETVVLESGIYRISEEAFKDDFNLKTVVFPDSLEVILSKAFAGCDSLLQFDLPGSLRTVDDDAFGN